MAAVIVAAESLTERYGDLISAVLILVAAFVVLYVVNRAMRGRVNRMTQALGASDLSPVVDTRLRFLRRVVDAAIIITGVALAVAQFTSLDRLATTVLASSAIAAAVIGFAARQVLANAIAGIVLAVTQPLRIGDLVTFEGETGTVEDVSLTYTWLRTGSDARIIIPNERLASGTLRNDSIRSPTVALEVSLWLPPGADETAALQALRTVPEALAAKVAEVTDLGLRIQVAGPPVAPSDRITREAALREDAVRALREAGSWRPDGEP
jgi:small conductance mechanosensitive channel